MAYSGNLKEQYRTELNGIDPDNDQFSVIDFSNVRDITVNAGDGGAGTITFQYSDGSADDIALGAEYFGLLRDVARNLTVSSAE